MAVEHFPKTNLAGVNWVYGPIHYADELHRMNPRAQIIHVAPNFSNLEGVRNKIDILLARQGGLHVLPAPGFPRDGKFFELLQWVNKEQGSIKSDIITSARFSFEWSRNLFLNMKYISKCPPIQRLMGEWKGKPAVVAASGPSLNDAIPELKKYRDRYLLISAGSSLSRLIDEGLKPDFCLSFDGGYGNYEAHFKGLKSDIPLIWDHIINHKILENYPGPMAIMRMWPLDFFATYLGEEFGSISIGPSIANTAMDFAAKIGADPIILTGQDCGYKGEKSHAEGIHLNGHINRSPKTDMFLEGVTDRINSDHTMQVFVNCFEIRLRDIKQKVINTSFGARLLGTVDMELSEALCNLPKVTNDLHDKLFQPVTYDIPKFKKYLNSSRLAGEWLSSQETIKVEYLREAPFLPYNYVLGSGRD